ncbi:hypothetical protein HGRIS_000788 [Hohenbuehelia grisea]|uniref:CENP-V/GFA domain-containing protein n=1 Tax=Hohenbuehelia grisea TaxID=104357 RepID=A0ABR3IPR4_9AGAR
MMTSKTNETRRGSCLCGQVQFELQGKPLLHLVCHCENCQRWSGSAFLSHYFLKPERVDIQQGKESVKTFSDPNTSSGLPMLRSFCSECGSSLFMKLASEPFTLVCASAVDEKYEIDPHKQLHSENQRSWVTIKMASSGGNKGGTKL